ncbi:hypothetical protein [Phytohabitans flavus]|uniref:hypothetical protein n=1 Tax=Phytohabitans flavus TaxID=1076124 RepID=UPI0015673CA7|nr:hypothetical protein [Phytohabitans flavus]
MPTALGVVPSSSEFVVLLHRWVPARTTPRTVSRMVENAFSAISGTPSSLACGTPRTMPPSPRPVASSRYTSIGRPRVPLPRPSLS